MKGQIFPRMFTECGRRLFCAVVVLLVSLPPDQVRGDGVLDDEKPLVSSASIPTSPLDAQTEPLLREYCFDCHGDRLAAIGRAADAAGWMARAHCLHLQLPPSICFSDHIFTAKAWFFPFPFPVS